MTTFHKLIGRLVRGLHCPSFDYHKVYEPLKVAARMSENNIVVLPLPTIWPPKAAWISGKPKMIMERFLSILTHLRLFGLVWKNRRRDMIILREFSNIPLLISWPLLITWNKKIYCLVNHNIQLANKNKVDRLALWLLSRMKCKFLCLESNDGSEGAGIALTEKNVCVIPFPIAGSPKENPTNREMKKYIGVIGRFRKEKGGDDLLNALYHARSLGEFDADILLGCPEQEVLNLWNKPGIKTVNTTSSEMYERAMDSCSVIVLNYEKDAYFYRHSGVITDAISNFKTVVCPEYPLLRSQVKSPVTVGFTFRNLSEIGEVVNSALEFINSDCETEFQKYHKYREPKAISKLLDLILSRKGAGKEE